MRLPTWGNVLIFAGLVYTAIVFTQFPKWTVDDAYITYRYAENFANHGQLTWNIGESPEEGYTGVALPFILGIFIKLGFSPVIMSPTIGIISYFAVGLFIYLILKKFDTKPLVNGICILFYFTLPFLYTNALSGLETILFTASITASLLAMINCLHIKSISPTKEIIFGLVLLFTSLIRPEGVALTIGCLIAMFYIKYTEEAKRQIPWKFLLIFTLTYVLPALIYFGWQMNYYGQLLPNTFYVKTVGGFHLDQIKDLVHFFLLFFSAPIISMLIVFLIDPDKSFQRFSEKKLLKPFKALLIASAIFTSLVIAQFIRSKLSMNFSYRFFVPLLPPLIIILFILFGISIPSLNSTRPESRLKFNLIITTLIFLSIYQLLTVTHRLKDEKKYIDNTNLLLNNEHIPAAQFIKSIVPVNEWMMILYDTGAIPYYTGLKTIDFGGFNDKKIARKIVNTAEQFRNYFFSFNPGVAVFTSYDQAKIKHDRIADSFADDPRFEDYILLKQFKPDSAALNQNYFLNVFIRKDLATTSTKK